MVHVYTYMYIHIHNVFCTCIHTRTYIHVYIDYMYIHVYIDYMYIHIHNVFCTCIHTRTYIHVYTDYIYTHTQCILRCSVFLLDNHHQELVASVFDGQVPSKVRWVPTTAYNVHYYAVYIRALLYTYYCIQCTLLYCIY